jgi:hypothetical protein
MNTEDSLIIQAIKSKTYYSHSYNKQSFIDTIMEYFDDGEELIVDKSIVADDSAAKFLYYIKQMQETHKEDPYCF